MMHYEDEARQLNFIGGLVIGTLFGVILALAGSPLRSRGGAGRMRDAAGSLRRAVGDPLSPGRPTSGWAVEGVAKVVRRGRDRLGV
jgi:hypothetical protein